MRSPKLPAPILNFPLISQWLSFKTKGAVRIRTGRVELGQGNYTALCQIAAEELDLDLDCIDIVGGDTRETPNEGFTSGSQSIAVGGLSVRIAASAARHLLLGEAATLLQADVWSLSVDGGRIIKNGEATDLDYWKVSETVSFDVEAANHANPKLASERMVVGRSLPRLELSERISGAPFVQDLDLPGILHGRPIHPPSMRATLLALDLDALSRRPGVVQIVRDGSFCGVVAKRESDAVEAAKWAHSNARWSDVADALDDPVSTMGQSREASEVIVETGEAASMAGRTFETVVSRPYLSHGSIGPSCALARWDDGRLTVWSHTQGVFPLRTALAQVFAISETDIEVIHVYGAGCYGHNGADDVALDAALLARVVPGRPVRVQWSREDEFRAAPLGPGMVTEVRAVIGGDNRIIAMKVTANSAPHGNRPGRNGAPNLRAAAYLEAPFPVPRSNDVPVANGGGADRNSVPPYTIPNLKVEKRLVHDLPYRTSSLRGLGAFTNVYAIETLMDDIAVALEMDPLEFRLAHLDDERARATLNGAAKLADWKNTRSGNGSGYGIGYARYKNAAAYCAVIVRVEVDEEVRVTHAWAHVDTGEVINPDGVLNQIEGGIIQSASWTLKEAIRFAEGAVASVNWEDYPILKFSEVPQVAVTLANESAEPPLGCAEASQGPTAAAIGNAVRNALGVRVSHLPLTRQAIIAASGA
ncbi:MAG: molybdopterin cofactor-binding domain-containing protein [Hyphomicrobiaceae bacterium]